ncbi:MAG: ABC transporter permease [Sulfuricaulis sp.]|uniref:ABC transporter permease n=1 Tax=Sulfuricaulis sp. TaxID=2003553 RepID=UPI0025E5A070|nr:ABC transporter permease [Sulfuricaulis sp.]MCR4346896.1 ABC transporter permease [Sulfuricaulis sp.]
MKHILAMMKKEFLQLRRDPRLIGFIVMAPVILLILFGLALKLEPANVKMAYVDQDKSFFTDLIKTNIWYEGYFKLYDVADEAAIIKEIRDGRARAGLFIKKDFSDKLSENQQPTVKMYVDGTMPSLATAMDNNSSAITDRKVTGDMYFLDANAPKTIIPSEPFILDIEILFNPDKKETWFFLPGVIGVLIMQIALILTSTAIVREKEYNTLEQIVVSPITRTEFILGKIFPYMLIAFADFYFILVLGWSMFDLPAASSQLMLFGLAFVYVVGLIALGLVISTVSQTQQQAIFLSIFILILSILLSGFIFPVEAMPVYIQPVAYLLPFTRGILLKDNDFLVLAPDYAALSGFAAVFIVISITRFKKSLD